MESIQETRDHRRISTFSDRFPLAEATGIELDDSSPPVGSLGLDCGDVHALNERADEGAVDTDADGDEWGAAEE